jgi:hypothetical protein
MQAAKVTINDTIFVNVKQGEQDDLRTSLHSYVLPYIMFSFLTSTFVFIQFHFCRAINVSGPQIL